MLGKIDTGKVGKVMQYYPPSGSPVLYLPLWQPYVSPTLDVSGNGNHGTITGASWRRLGSGLWYLFFDGATGKDDLVTVTASASIAKLFDNGGTIGCWLNPESDGEGDAAKIMHKRTVAGWSLRMGSEASGKVKLTFTVDFDGTDGEWVTTATAVSINTWSKITLTYSSALTTNDPIIYVNGASIALTESSTPVGTRVDDTTENLILGNTAGTTGTFDGGMTLWEAQKVIKPAAQVLDEYRRDKHLLGV